MPGPVFLRGDEVSLHPVERDDLPFVQRYENDPAVRHGLTIADPRNADQMEANFERHREGDGEGFLVCVRDDAHEDDYRPVGFVALFDVERPAGRAELACWIAPEDHVNGFATAATELLVQHAFDERRLHRVVAHALASNEASRRVLGEKVGMVEEAVERDAKFVDGHHEDVYQFRLLESEWRAGRS
ncbi:MAG: GNAT family N-acetyltransferase [Halanaeroarchaeum sp.]